MRRRLGLPSATATAVALVLVLAVGPAAAPLGAAIDPPPDGPWVRPVDGAVVRAFSAPATPYGPGHRGAKLAAAPGTPVRAAGAGTVTFAGTVAGTHHVVVAHPGGLRTSYSYLGDIAVHAGQVVARGEVVGHSGDGPHEPPHSLHLGLRRGDTYLDPMLLFDRDLADLVRLVPVDGEPAGAPWPASPDRLHLLRELAPPPEWVRTRLAAASGPGDGGLAAAVTGVVGGIAGTVGGALDRSRTTLARAGTAALGIAGDLAPRLYDWSARNVPPVQAFDDLVTAGRRFVEWVEHRRTCDPAAPDADGTGGSRHSLVAVAGINSATGADGATFGLDADALGYDPDEIHYFSYAADGGDHDPEDTWVDLRVSAERLGETLRERQRAAPGREVDLVAHSQGGIVVAAFLQHVYDPTDPAYPPIGTVVTLASPHQGAPLASALDRLERSVPGRRAVDGLRRAGLGLPLGRSTTQLSEHSELVRDLWSRPPYEQLDVTSIAGTDDVVVPADRTAVPDATLVTLAVGGLSDHTAIPSDPAALRAVRAALERRDPPCVSLVDGLRGAVVPVVISRAQTNLGDLSAGAARGLELARGPLG